MTEKEKQEIIELVHKTLRGFFGPFPEGELGARPLTQTEKTLLEVNKVLCEKIKEIPTIERPRGEWTSNGNDLEYICSVCGEDLPYSDEYDYQTNFCPNCGAPMNEEAFKKYNGLEEGEQNEWRKF